jgi:hypothetical protein
MRYRSHWRIALLVLMVSALAAREPRPPKPKTADDQTHISTQGTFT